MQLGVIGRSEASTVNQNIETYIPMLVGLFKAGKIVPNELEVVGNVGFQSVIEAWQLFQKTSGSEKKLVVKLQNP